MEEFNHQVQVERGVLEQECTDMLTDFFRELRVRNKAEKQMRREAQELSGDS
jgi:tRNA(adenine34) deaminase